jgi:multiple sugar transport system ATP-binding protein
MAKVSLKNVSKIYPREKGGEINAVKDLSLEIADREFVVLAGSPGCGKSTVLRMIAGLEEISKGDIYIDEKHVNGVAPKDRDIAMVFQNYALYPHMSVYHNLAFGLKLRKFSKPEIKKRVVDAASILGIESLLDRKPKALSVAQQQRVAVGRAIVRQPKVYLFDEPLFNLDPKMRVQMRTEIIKLHQRLQATMIYVTHDQIEAMTMGDRIAVMNDGRVQQIDVPLVLYNEPVNLFVAGFLGSPSMNFISGILKEDGDKLRFREDEGGTIEVVFAAADRPAAREFVGQNVILGIRPENLDVATLSRKEGKAAGTGFPAIVDIVEPVGAETDLHLETGAHTLVCRTQSAFDRSEAGRRLQFEMNLAKAHLFDPVSTVGLR